VRSALFVIASCLVSCGNGESDPRVGANAGAEAGPEAAAPPPEGPYAITCTVSRRDLAAGETVHERQTLDFQSDDDGAKSVVLGGVTVEASLRSAEDAPGDALFRVNVREAFVNQEVRLSRTRVPSFAFVGAHGLFSGLVYAPERAVYVDVQYMCVARPFGVRPPSGTRSPEGEPTAPLHVRCDVQHSTDADAGVDRQETVELATAGERAVDFADVGFRASVGEDSAQSTVRAIVLQVTPSRATSGGGYWLQHALQIDETVPLPDLFGGALGFTGRVTVGSPSGAAVSYVCRSLDE
jgi:hypothetical protein